MKQITLTGLLFLLAFVSSAQTEEENGKIYIKHPAIDVVNKSMKAYADKDFTSIAPLYADTAKVYYSRLPKPMTVAEAIKDWTSDHEFYDSIKVTVRGYPDYLHYKDKDQKIVQSWWTWSGKSKKTGEKLVVEFVQFDEFNSAGKIEMEAIYGDFSKLMKNP